ncbi:MAG: hypothetical protein NC037_05885 [Bacteroides sp.]|nr:hypothetical protein [Bacillota bacterium]MCM1393373.1 hypothetical protein [[Eubacterium] siraeum]MCM1456035.1 hypothetical protein [Bacteroides sp.]
MNVTNNKCFDLMKKVEQEQQLTYDEFIDLVRYGLEMQFCYEKRKFGITHFNGYEFYEWNKEECYQNYPTIEEFATQINIDGILVKDVWDKITKINFAD